MSLEEPKAPDEAKVSRLHDSRPDWVARLGTGANYMYWGMLISFFNLSRVAFIGPTIGLCRDVVYFIGIWMITAPEPVDSHRAMGIRALTRGVSVLAVTIDIVFAAVSYVPDLSVQTIRGVALCIGGVSLLLTAFHIANLAGRIPNLRLATQSRFVITSYAIMVISVGAFTIGAFTVDGDSMREYLGGDLTAAEITFLVLAPVTILLITAVWYLFILHRFGKLLTQEAETAEALSP